MRRLTAIVATLVLGLGAFACDSGNGSDNDPDQTAADQTATDQTGQDGQSDLAIPDTTPDVPRGDLQPDLADVTADQVPQDQIDQINPPECPATFELANGGACSEEGQQCTYGEECCCDTCFPSIKCHCAGGSYGCYYTEACMPPSCEDNCCDPTDDGTCSYWSGEEVPYQCMKFEGWDSGHCLPPVDYPYCWADDQCHPGQKCKDADICSCTEFCDMWQVAGVCEDTQAPEGCCLTDEECDLGINMAFQCGFLPGQFWGVCLPLATGIDECWDPSDCDAGEVCEGATFCPCGSLCGQIQAPGHCVAKPAGLPCLQDSQCGAGDVCVGAASCVGDWDCTPQKGKCQPVADPGLCWSDADCGGLGDVCVNPISCLGGEVCLKDEHPGSCLPAPITGCWADADCPPPMGVGMALCSGEWVIPWWLGIDFDVDADPDHEGECCTLLEGQCHDDTQCPAGQSCHGAVYELGGCAAGTATPGTCQNDSPWPDELCFADNQCSAGQLCIGAWECPKAARCQEAAYPGLCLTTPANPSDCFEDSGCAAGTTCKGAWVCDVVDGEMCGGLMASPGTCQPLPAGTVGDPCGLYGGPCGSGLACCYPCGIPGCIDQCSVPCDSSDPWCVDGCGMMP